MHSYGGQAKWTSGGVWGLTHFCETKLGYQVAPGQKERVQGRVDIGVGRPTGQMGDKN